VGDLFGREPLMSEQDLMRRRSILQEGEGQVVRRLLSSNGRGKETLPIVRRRLGQDSSRTDLRQAVHQNSTERSLRINRLSRVRAWGNGNSTHSQPMSGILVATDDCWSRSRLDGPGH
jgi:hypothetical protein